MKSKKTSIRLNHFLSSAGVCARRKADDIIRSKIVTINNKRVKNPLIKVHPEIDNVKLEGKLVKPTKQKRHIAFNKPRKVITSMNDPKKRLCVADYFKKQKDRIFPVGRLDWNSEGLLLLTNNGDFAMKIAEKKIPKTYIVKVDGYPSAAQIAKLKKGVYTEVGKLKALYIEPLRKQTSQHSCWIKVILNEGRNRQLHRMFEKIGFQIKILRRTAIGRLKLRALKPGECFFLSPVDIKKVFSFPSEVEKMKKIRPLFPQKRKVSNTR